MAIPKGANSCGEPLGSTTDEPSVELLLGSHFLGGDLQGSDELSLAWGFDMTRSLLSHDVPDIDAYCSTGVSPGHEEGSSRSSIRLDYHGKHDVDLLWEIHGPTNGSPIVVLGGISAGRHLQPTAANPSPGWWAGVVKTGGALDPSTHRLIGVEFLGGAQCPFPTPGPITTEDQARVLAEVLNALGIQHVSLIGASYGGMVALAFAELFPERARELLLFCAAHRTHPMATAWRSLQRSLVRFAEEVGHGNRGLALARGLAMTTYRSPEEFENRFDVNPTYFNQEKAACFEVEDYLEARGRAFSRCFDTDGFLRLSESIDLHCSNPSAIKTPSTLVSFDTDALVPPWLVEDLASQLPSSSEHIRISSIYGHDAFLKESRQVSDVIRLALNSPKEVLQ